ncbi:RrF2 family transcriptional regulator [Clostridium formicaceticum]|uniref:Transcriptional regulator n=1 Tax=Clostridium formicaceticum TaxID=1497 RepID=A0AAC9RHU2_9CLOT|nr:Rrf2 family transcriptional regulator [Clostridium formicaceticum]AOY76832.1 transcriptional regulator [Clostridium formicaceticum]ARE87306.1 HTH-type transcriptional regulator CymR [Clostridium formicaceticum]
MKITQEADYAFRMILYLSKVGRGTRVDAHKISESENIPTRFALKILRKLTKAGLTKSFRGINGGYTLNRDPENITFKDVIEAIDGPIYINRCLYDEDYCNLHRTNTCDVHRELAKIRDTVIGVLEKVNFKSIMEKNEINYHK